MTTSTRSPPNCISVGPETGLSDAREIWEGQNKPYYAEFCKADLCTDHKVVAQLRQTWKHLLMIMKLGVNMPPSKFCRGSISEVSKRISLKGSAAIRETVISHMKEYTKVREQILKGWTD